MCARNKHHTRANMYLNVNIKFILLLKCLVICTLQLGASKQQSRESSKPRPPLDCVVSVPRNGNYMPIPLVKSNTGESIVIYPDKNGKIVIKHKNDFRMSCSGSKLASPTDIDRENVITTCFNGSLVYEEKNYEFSQFKCERNPQPIMLLTNKRCAVAHNRIIEIGFMTIFGFKILYKACFNVNFKSTLYTWYFVDPPISNYRQKQVDKPTFINRDFKNHADASGDNITFTISKKGLEMIQPRNVKIVIDVMDTYCNQTHRLEEILNSKKLVHKYIKKHNRHFIVPDHLIPTTEFVYLFQQNATYFYENTIPQWSFFSEDIWTEVEKLFMRTRANVNSTHLIVTGVYQISTFLNSTGDRTPFYLHPSNRMPVPQFRWKMDYDIASATGVVYVAMCDPYSPMKETPPICETIPCPGYDEFSPAARELLYCCSKESFGQVYHIDSTLFMEF